MTAPDKPDELDAELEALGRLQRERLAGRVDDWDRLAAGELSADELRAQRLAAGDSPEQVERGVELFAPFDEQDDRALAKALLGESSSNDKPAGPAPIKLRRFVVLGSLLSIAAAAALVWLMGPGEGERDVTATLDSRPLPDYELTFNGGVELVRGEPTAGRKQLAPETAFEWILQPVPDLDGPIVVELFAYPQRGEGRRLGLQATAADISEHGAIRLAGTGARLGLEPGVWTIVAVIARDRAALPGEPAAADPRRGRASGSWRQLAFELEIIE